VLPRRQANRPVVRDARGDRVALAAPARSRRILLAEDNELNVAAIGDCLQDLGYEVVVAHDGRQAVDLAVETLPELVLMDVQMPGMDGLEAIGVLRKRQEFTRVPIVALTGLAMPGDRERCEAAGASAHLPKPVSLKEMTELMERLLAEVG
jgi:CheY-like chemotaxis protein